MRALLLASLAMPLLVTGCAVTASEGEDVEELVPAKGKSDGAAATTFTLRPDQPRRMFEVTCDEWVSCDLALSISTPSTADVLVRITRASDGKVTELDLLTLPCVWPNGDVGTTSFLLAPGQATPPATTSCLDTEGYVSSPDADETFTIEIAKNAWPTSLPAVFSVHAYWE